MCQVDPDIFERKNLQPQHLRDLKVPKNFKKVERKKVEDPTNFSQVQRVLIVVHVVPGTQQIWAILEEAKVPLFRVGHSIYSFIPI